MKIKGMKKFNENKGHEIFFGANEGYETKVKGCENFHGKFKGCENLHRKFKGYEKFSSFSEKLSNQVFGLIKDRPLS